MKNSEKMLAKIKDRKVKPIPKWHFWAKNILFWTLFLISVKLGSLAFAIILFAIENTEFDMLSHMTHSKIELFFSMLPLFWIIFLGIFLWGAEWIFQKTKTGYRYSPIFIAGGSFILSIVIGTILFFTGGGEKLEQKFAEKISFYESVNEQRIKRWSDSKNGLLSGKIIIKEKSLVLEDWNGKQFVVKIDRAIIKGGNYLKEGNKIKIIGKLDKNNVFIADEIRPWQGHGFHGGRNRKN